MALTWSELNYCAWSDGTAAPSVSSLPLPVIVRSRFHRHNRWIWNPQRFTYVLLIALCIVLKSEARQRLGSYYVCTRARMQKSRALVSFRAKMQQWWMLIWPKCSSLVLSSWDSASEKLNKEYLPPLFSQLSVVWEGGNKFFKHRYGITGKATSLPSSDRMAEMLTLICLIHHVFSSFTILYMNLTSL